MNPNERKHPMQDQQGATERPQLKPFAALVQELNNGSVHDDLSTALADLVAATTETGKKGTITLRLTVAPQKDEVTTLVTADVAVKAPRQDVKPALFFPDEHGNLLRSDPRQLDISSLREVPGGKAEPRNIRGDEATG